MGQGICMAHERRSMDSWRFESWLPRLTDMLIIHRCKRGGDVSFSLMSKAQELSSPQADFYVTSPPSLQEMQSLKICVPSYPLLQFPLHGRWLSKGSLTTEPQISLISAFAPGHSYLLLLLVQLPLDSRASLLHGSRQFLSLLSTCFLLPKVKITSMHLATRLGRDSILFHQGPALHADTVI